MRKSGVILAAAWLVVGAMTGLGLDSESGPPAATLVRFDPAPPSLASALSVLSEKDNLVIADSDVDVAPAQLRQLPQSPVPFFAALDALARQGGLTPVYGVDGRPGIRMETGLTPPALAADHGPFRLLVERVQTSRHPQHPERDGLTVELRLVWEPRLGYRPRMLQLDDTSGFHWSDGTPHPLARGTSRRLRLADEYGPVFTLRGPLPPRGQPFLAHLTVAGVIWWSPTTFACVFDDLSRTTTINQGSVRATLGPWPGDRPGNVEVGVEYLDAPFPWESHEGWVVGGPQLTLRRPDGGESHYRAASTAIEEGRAVRHYFVEVPPWRGPTAGLRAILQVPAAPVAVPVRFVARNVPLP